MMAAFGVTKRRILAAIAEHTDEKGYPPTCREIGGAVGLKSTSTVHLHLTELAAAGLLERDPALTRALRIPGRKPGGGGRERAGAGKDAA